ncbi:hypothetical protein HanXRQr2_Chr16g0723531 [Helianthus annuus]|nr:hypothetical protein HanXRQr2_Chr16g0723531 [Helianthus annuus]KAJ0819256.1 hypothetical protein HanPSC8_Chr16g0694001 [Helianthus annuus]
MALFGLSLPTKRWQGRRVRQTELKADGAFAIPEHTYSELMQVVIPK